MRVLASESRRLAEESGLVDADVSLSAAGRRRRIIREMTRRYPRVLVEVSVRRGKEEWRVTGPQHEEAAALDALQDLLRPDSIITLEDPFAVGRLEIDELAERIGERAAILEVD